VLDLIEDALLPPTLTIPLTLLPSAVDPGSMVHPALRSRRQRRGIADAVYLEGLELEPATVPRTIFERPVKEGRAEVAG
jgi:hypothetical protein